MADFFLFRVESGVSFRDDLSNRISWYLGSMKQDEADEAVKRFLKLSLTVPTFFNIILFVVTHECGTQIDAWLSLVERCVRDAEVAGSNPVASTFLGPEIADK